MSDKRPSNPVSLRGTFQAGISGTLRGIDASLVLLAAILVAGMLAAAFVTRQTRWALVPLFACALFLMWILIAWWRGAPARQRIDTSLVKVEVGRELTRVTAYLPDQEMALRTALFARTIIQNRADPPIPKGEVRGSPADQSGLTEYTNDQREAVVQRWQDDIREWDRKVLAQLATAEKSLPVQSKAPDDEPPPIPQPEQEP